MAINSNLQIARSDDGHIVRVNGRGTLEEKKSNPTQQLRGHPDVAKRRDIGISLDGAVELIRSALVATANQSNVTREAFTATSYFGRARNGPRINSPPF